jgi:DNA-binding transcriptional LysR family regulator
MFVDSDAIVSGFSIERLRAFCRVAEAGSIVSAAKGDPTRQSQFSRQIKELEDFFGTKLVERAGKTIRLTENGKKVALLTQTFLRSVQDLRAGASKGDVIRLGAGESLLRWVIMPHLEAIQSLDPNVRFDFVTQRTEECVESLKRGILDLAIVRKDAADESLNAIPCGSLNYVIIVPRTLLPGRTAAGLRLVRKLPFAMLSGDGVLARGVVALASKLEIELDIRVRAENFSLLISAVENATLATVIPEPAVKLLSKERFAVIEIDESAALTRHLVVAFSADAANLRQGIRRVAPRLTSLLLSQQ